MSQTIFKDPVVSIAPVRTGTGTGSVSVDRLTHFTVAQVYTLTCIAKAPDCLFSVAGSLDGNVGIAVVGTQFYDQDLKIFLTITQGSTVFEIGDQFVFTVANGTDLNQANIDSYDELPQKNFGAGLRGTERGDHTLRYSNTAQAASKFIQGLKYVAATAGAGGNAISIEYLNTVAAIQATLDEQDLTYTAVTPGAAGNGITLSYIEWTPAAAARVTIQNLQYQAVTAGTGGNSITVAYTTGGTAGAEIVSVVGSAISVQIQSGASTASQIASAIAAFPAAAALVTTAFKPDNTHSGDFQTAPVSPTSLTGGAASIGAAGSEVVSVTGSAITVTLQGGVSTAGQVKTAIDASSPAHALVAVNVSGNVAGAQTSFVGTHSLGTGADQVGGAGSESVAVVGGAIQVTLESGKSTATQVKAAVDASSAAHALVAVSIITEASAVQYSPRAVEFLSGGKAKYFAFNHDEFSDSSSFAEGNASIHVQDLNTDGKANFGGHVHLTDVLSLNDADSVNGSGHPVGNVQKVINTLFAQRKLQLDFASDGTFRWSGTQLSFTQNLEIWSRDTGIRNRILVTQSPFSIADGESLYVNLFAPANADLTAATGATIPDTFPAFRVATRVGSKLYWYNGAISYPNDVGRLGEGGNLRPQLMTVVTEGGTVSMPSIGGSISWSAPIKIKALGSSAVITIAAGSASMSDDDVAYVDLDDPIATTTRTLVVVPRSQADLTRLDRLWVFHRSSNRIYIRNGTNVQPGEETTIGDSLSDDTISYIGAASRTDNAPAYTTSNGGPTANRFVDDGDNLTKGIKKLDAELGAHEDLVDHVHGVTGHVVGTSDTQVLTNKTIAAASNTISGLTDANLSGSAGISNANLAVMPSRTFKGNATGSSATPTDLPLSTFAIYVNVKDFGAVGDGMADDTIPLQNAAAAAVSTEGTLFFPPGTYNVTDTVAFASHVQGSQATIATALDIVAVQVGDGSNILFDKLIFLPNVTRTGYTSPGWSDIHSTGVEVRSTYHCEIHVGHITGFLLGLYVTSSGAHNCAYNNFFLGDFEDNKIQLLIEPANNQGAVNENNFFGGRFQFGGGQAAGTGGCRQLLIRMFADPASHPPNNNVFYKPSFEDDAPEFTVELSTTEFIYIDHARWESSAPSVKFSEFSSSLACFDNTINLGFGAHNITVTTSAHSADNKVYTDLTSKIEAHGGVAGIKVYSNTDGSQYPIFTGLEAQTGGTFWTVDPATDFAFQICADHSTYKRQADSQYRLKLDHVNGRVFFGDGGAGIGGYIDSDPGTSNLRIPAGGLTITGAIAASNFSGSNTGDVTLATFGSTPAAAGASLSGQVLTLQPADATHPGGVSTGTQTFGGNKTFSGTIAASNFSGSSSGTNSGDVSLAAVGASPAAEAASFSGQVLTLQPADATHPGVVTSGTQTFGGNKTFAGTVAASNLSGTNSGDVSLAAVGSTPSANAASLSGQALTLQPADGTHPGVITSGTQTIGGDKTFTGAISASNLSGSTSGTNSGDVTLGAVGSSPSANAATFSGQVLTLQPADGTHPGVVSTGTQTFGGDKTFSGAIAASNFTGSHSGTSSGTNSGDITLATFGSTPAAEGASLSGQALTLQPADATHPGGVSTGTQSFGGNKTFTGTIAASNFSGTSSGTNSGDATLAAVGSSPSANAASFSGQVLTLQPADGTHPGVVTSGTQTFGGDKTFSGAIAASNFSGTFSGTSSGTNSGDVTLAAVGAAPSANAATFSGQVLTLQPADGTHPGVVTSGTQTFGGDKTFSGAISASNFSGSSSGANTGDITLVAVGSTPSANAASLSGQVLTIQPADGTHPGVVTSGTQTFGGNKTFSGTVGASNLSGTNTGDLTLAAFGSTPSSTGASLSGQALTLEPADATNPGGVSTTTQTFAGDKTISGATTPLTIKIAGDSATVVAQMTSTGDFASQFNMDNNRAANGNTLGSIRSLWNATLVSSISFLAGVTSGSTKDDGVITFATRSTGGANTERMRVTSAGEFKVGTTGSVSNTNEKVTFSSTITTDADSAGLMNRLIANINAGSTNAYYGITSQLTRQITTSQTDGSQQRVAIRGLNVFTLPTAQTLTLSSSGTPMYATFLAQASVVSGAGTLALSDFAKFYAEADTVVSGTNKYGIYIGAMTGATNNYGVYQAGSTTKNVFNGPTTFLGTQTNDSAATGFVGEYLESKVTTPTNVPGSTTQWGDATSKVLGAGDWEITGVVSFTLNGATMGANTNSRIAISLTPGNSATGIVQGDNSAEFPVPATTSDRSGIVVWRQSFSTSTTVYLKELLTYTGGPPQYTCRLSANRVR